MRLSRLYTFTLGARVCAVGVCLCVAGTVDAEVLSCDWLIAVTWTRHAALPISTVELTRMTVFC